MTDKINVVFVYPNGDEKTIEAQVGLSILDVAHKNKIPLEGACEGSLACSTCHVYIEEKYFNKLPEPAEEEEDMLDLAFELKETSRLGCQIVLTKEHNGMRISLPNGTRNVG
jgi:ferredoxin